MATRARILPFFSFLIILASISTNGNSVNSPPPPCAAFDCGNGLALGYPFHPQIHHQHFCGYPNLAISCTNNQPILHISNKPYTVKKLNNSDSSITVTYGGAGDEDAAATCPIAHPIALGANSLLDYNNTDNKFIRFYYNCTVYPPSAAGIKCLQRGAQHSYAFVEGSEPETDWMRYCESDVTVPLIGNAVDDLRNGSGSALNLGFKLTWKKPIEPSCQLCEESGGLCGYNSNGDQNFVCFCSGRNSSPSCHVSSEVSKTSKSNYVVIGAVTLTIVIFFMKRIKIRVQAHGFNRLPTTHGK